MSEFNEKQIMLNAKVLHDKIAAGAQDGEATDFLSALTYILSKLPRYMGDNFTSMQADASPKVSAILHAGHIDESFVFELRFKLNEEERAEAMAEGVYSADGSLIE